MRIRLDIRHLIAVVCASNWQISKVVGDFESEVKELSQQVSKHPVTKLLKNQEEKKSDLLAGFSVDPRLRR